jgi:hypothetical protein
VNGVCCPGRDDVQFCTYTKGKFNSNSKNPLAKAFADNYGVNIFTSGIKIGEQTAPNGLAPWTAYWTPTTTGRDKLRTYLTANSSGGSSGSLGADTTNATSSPAANQGAQTLALEIAVGLSGTTYMPVPPLLSAGLGDLEICPNGTMPSCSVPTVTVQGLIDISNVFLSGGTVSGWTASGIKGLLDSINNAFDDCTLKDPAWIAAYTGVPSASKPNKLRCKDAAPSGAVFFALSDLAFEARWSVGRWPPRGPSAGTTCRRSRRERRGSQTG